MFDIKKARQRYHNKQVKKFNKYCKGLLKDITSYIKGTIDQGGTYIIYGFNFEKIEKNKGKKYVIDYTVPELEKLGYKTDFNTESMQVKIWGWDEE